MTTSPRRLPSLRARTAFLAVALSAGALCVAAPASAAEVPPALAPVPAPIDPQVLTVLAETNDARAAAGCVPLVLSDQLNRVAVRHSSEMAATGALTHRGLDGSSLRTRLAAEGVFPRRAAENVAAGFDAATVVDAWLGSRGHRVNVLDCRLRTVGIAEAPGAAGPYWTQVLASA